MNNIFIEKGYQKVSLADILTAVKEEGKKMELSKDEIKNIKLYIKPEDNKVYFVAGDKLGSVNIPFHILEERNKALKNFPELINLVFDENNEVKLCERDICKELIYCCNVIKPGNYGDTATGFMNVKNILKLKDSI